jgi:hypothetical protein
MVGNTEESEESDVSDDTEDSDDIDAEEIADVGEESGKPNNQENPFFTGNDNSEVWILMMTLIWRMKIRPNLIRKRRMT